MSDRKQPRDLTPGPRRWKAVGGDFAHQCTFCGGSPTEAVVGAPDGDAGILWQVAVCHDCLVDCISTRLAAITKARELGLRGESRRRPAGRPFGRLFLGSVFPVENEPIRL
jgi:hypothetical protein